MPEFVFPCILDVEDECMEDRTMHLSPLPSLGGEKEDLPRLFCYLPLVRCVQQTSGWTALQPRGSFWPVSISLFTLFMSVENNLFVKRILRNAFPGTDISCLRNVIYFSNLSAFANFVHQLFQRQFTHAVY